jgi:hypothetical protein
MLGAIVEVRLEAAVEALLVTRDLAQLFYMLEIWTACFFLWSAALSFRFCASHVGRLKLGL